MNGRLAVIIGGGSVALRKLQTLLAAGAFVRLVATEVCPDIAALGVVEKTSIKTGPYKNTDLEGAFLVVAATGDAAVNEQVCVDARERGILVAAVGSSGTGDCSFPALLQRGSLEIAVSTGGRCPSFAVDVRDEIARHIGIEYGHLLEQLAAEREKLLTNGSSSTYNGRVLHLSARRLISELTERKEQLP